MAKRRGRPLKPVPMPRVGDTGRRGLAVEIGEPSDGAVFETIAAILLEPERFADAASLRRRLHGLVAAAVADELVRDRTTNEPDPMARRAMFSHLVSEDLRLEAASDRLFDDIRKRADLVVALGRSARLRRISQSLERRRHQRSQIRMLDRSAAAAGYSIAAICADRGLPVTSRAVVDLALEIDREREARFRIDGRDSSEKQNPLWDLLARLELGTAEGQPKWIANRTIKERKQRLRGGNLRLVDWPSQKPSRMCSALEVVARAEILPPHVAVAVAVWGTTDERRDAAALDLGLEALRTTQALHGLGAAAWLERWDLCARAVVDLALGLLRHPAHAVAAENAWREASRLLDEYGRRTVEVCEEIPSGVPSNEHESKRIAEIPYMHWALADLDHHQESVDGPLIDLPGTNLMTRILPIASAIAALHSRLEKRWNDGINRQSGPVE